MQFNELEFGPHSRGMDGVQATVFFENGYGASVVKFVVGGLSGSYGSLEGLWELAVLEGNKDSWHLTYDTPITNDVLGHLSKADVTQHLGEIAALPSVEKAA